MQKLLSILAMLFTVCFLTLPLGCGDKKVVVERERVMGRTTYPPRRAPMHRPSPPYREPPPRR